MAWRLTSGLRGTAWRPARGRWRGLGCGRRCGGNRGGSGSARRLCPGLRFQLRVMFREKRSNFIGHGQQRDPLLLIERDGKATEAIHGHAPLLTDLGLTVRPRSRFRRAFSALSRSSSACRLSSTLGGSSIQVIVRGVTPGRVTRLYPGLGALPRTSWHIGLTQQVRWAVRPWAGLRDRHCQT